MQIGCGIGFLLQKLLCYFRVIVKKPFQYKIM